MDGHIAVIDNKIKENQHNFLIKKIFIFLTGIKDEDSFICKLPLDIFNFILTQYCSSFISYDQKKLTKFLADYRNKTVPTASSGEFFSTRETENFNESSSEIKCILF